MGGWVRALLPEIMTHVFIALRKKLFILAREEITFNVCNSGFQQEVYSLSSPINLSRW